jgi:hypothetical protein
MKMENARRIESHEDKLISSNLKDFRLTTRHPTTNLPSQAAKSAEHFLDQRHHHLILRQAPYTIVKLKTRSQEDFDTATPRDSCAGGTTEEE